MKVILSFLAGFFCMTSCFSQNSDPAAKQILDQASAKIKSFKSVKALFTLQIEDAQGVSQGIKKGTVYMKDAKYIVMITGQEIYCDGKTIWTYDKSANEVTITKVDPTSDALSPQKLFTSFYDKDFLYKVNGEQKMGTKTVVEIEMTPVDKTRNFHKVYLYVDKKTHLISSGKVLEKNGNRYIYTMNSLNGNAGLTDASFTFDKSKHPGVEEVNLTQ
ncbi:MAG TPA: outer membrane lipoprotein carrier protein LolA [Chitinophagaceae bacterium]|jgi:outer membrane lipoprotein carrier protein|nr:outer membrane lipoprotein carrier protein LolA [Chitinophagaceae bacterium]